VHFAKWRHLEMIQKGQDQWCVQLLDTELRRAGSDTPRRELEQQFEGMRIGFAAVGAEPALSRQVILHELRNDRRKGCHEPPSVKSSSAAAEISASSSGVRCRYQYVYRRLECPM
jgi:hypothetical protein